MDTEILRDTVTNVNRWQQKSAVTVTNTSKQPKLDETGILEKKNQKKPWKI